VKISALHVFDRANKPRLNIEPHASSGPDLISWIINDFHYL